MIKKETLFENFAVLDIRVGTIQSAKLLKGARKSAYVLSIDFGPCGIMQSSAQITELYTPEDLVGRKITAVVNFAPKRVAGFISECLVLGVYTDGGVSLLHPGESALNGDVIG
ncbi:MAG: tRNA-binding protein [Flavobacteriales bacterium]|nr:tRNA-binding protein [Flavobacteriales bacterium]